MNIEITGANEHNLQNVDVEFGDGLTVVTGVSGSGKTSLVFDTLYHEARRRFLEIFSLNERLAPANVRSITGVGPAVAVGQNLLNRNPGSTLATASGLHPFFRLLYAVFGQRSCAHCGAAISIWTEDEIVERIAAAARSSPAVVRAPLMRSSPGSHRTLLVMLLAAFDENSLWIDGRTGAGIVALRESGLDPRKPHDIDLEIAHFDQDTAVKSVRAAVQQAWSLGASAVIIEHGGGRETLSRAPVCAECGAWFGELRPVHFHTPCPYCQGQGCPHCHNTGLHPDASAVHWQHLRLPELLAHTVDQVAALFASASFPDTAARLRSEITRRLQALQQVGLGYIALDRSSPTLSRGEAQRVRLAVALTSRLEDMLHVLDEPTIGLHPADVQRITSAFRDLAGPVIYVEHDRIAAATADHAVDIGPGAGLEGGQVIYHGDPAGLWEAPTATGRYFSLRERVQPPQKRPAPRTFLTVRGAYLRNLQHIDVPIPQNRLTVITGVSGSGKSTFVEDVLTASLLAGKPLGCDALEGAQPKVVIVDQSPIGRNPRSNPATYTKLADIIRDAFAAATGLSASHFSFNRPEGACTACQGIGAVEVTLRYLPSTWIPCDACDGQRFSEEVLEAVADFGGFSCSIADFYKRPIADVAHVLRTTPYLSTSQRAAADAILRALCDIGLGYLQLGQPSPTLSGGEAQRIKLAKFLGKRSLSNQMLILDEPSTGLHPRDVTGLLVVLDRLVRSGATVVIVEHNTDIIRAADWIIDLGPGAGPDGGRLLYAGPGEHLLDAPASLTADALRSEDRVVPRHTVANAVPADAARAPSIRIRGARAHNLQNVDVDFPKGRLTVVTGVSGSGKSSLVGNVLETEARRRFLETLSIYERQGVQEGPEAPVDEVAGLGVAVSIDGRVYAASGHQWRNPRHSVGAATEIAHHLAVLMASLGERDCPQCGKPLTRRSATREIAATLRSGSWVCASCGASFPLPAPRHFSPFVYAAVCKTCHGVGTLRKPNPAKLIIDPGRPICGGAMYSPGFFPKGYLCKPMNGGYEAVQAVAERFGFDVFSTPWNQMTAEAQQAFLFGLPDKLRVHHQSRNGTTSTHEWHFPGFYGWVRDWDVGGTYTDEQICPDCGGARLRPEYAAVTLAGYTQHQLSQMPFSQLAAVMATVDGSDEAAHRAGMDIVLASLHTIQKRLGFLQQVGLGYLHLNRDTTTLSAGEAQRIKLAGLLGSGLTSLTLLIDEPSRGMHPSEIDALVTALHELRSEGNTVVVVEHEPGIIRAADHLVDMGPGPGKAGGLVVAQGVPEAVARADTITARWLRGERRIDLRRRRREPRSWLVLRGARANNLRGEEARLPLGCLVGVCGVSGSGKSTLIIDTLGRILSPKKYTTSVAFEPIDPGAYDSLEGAPARALIVDQVKTGVRSPATFLGLIDPLHALYAESEDAQVLGMDAKALGQRCSVCGGWGSSSIDMGFLPSVQTLCEACNGTGYRPEAWDVKVGGVALPEVFNLTLDEVYALFGDSSGLRAPLEAARDVGLGYLVMRQPGYALSGGEVQRLKIADELSRPATSETLYILDEPTVGQHLEDVARLAGVLHRLVDAGHTVVVVEHHAHLLAACDWLIELGPGGGPDGGHIVAQGAPERVVESATPTAPYLREILADN